jgi:hypothetical protein
MKRISLVVAVAMALSFVFAQEKMEKKEAKMQGKKEMMEKKEAKMEMKGTEWNGYLADVMCSKRLTKDEKKAAKHTVGCALEEACAESGYGLIHEGAYHKFDDKGDRMAKEWLEKLQAEGKQKDNLMIAVSGKMEGDKLMVASLKPAAMMMDKIEKKEEMKMEKKEEMKKN